MPDQIHIDQLTENDWKEIKSISLKLYLSGKLGQNEMKIYIYAFFGWLESNGKMIVLDADGHRIVH